MVLESVEELDYKSLDVVHFVLERGRDGDQTRFQCSDMNRLQEMISKG